MPIDFNTISNYNSRYLSSFREIVVQITISFHFWQKKPSDITVVPVKQQIFKLVLLFGILLLVFHLLFVKSLAIAYDAAAVMFWTGGIFILSRHTTRLSLKNNLKQPYLSIYEPLNPNYYEQISNFYRR